MCRQSFGRPVFVINLEKVGTVEMIGKALDSIGFVSVFDEEVASMMRQELIRQQDGLELIASENFTSPAVMAAMGMAAPSG